MNFEEFLKEFEQFQIRAFGPTVGGQNVLGVIDHLKEEIAEVEEDPSDLLEWIDCIFLSFGGALRSGHTVEEIIDAMNYKFNIVANERVYPPWQTLDQIKAVHRTGDNRTVYLPTCNGICFPASDFVEGVSGIAHAHPDCELHGDLAKYETDGTPR